MRAKRRLEIEDDASASERDKRTRSIACHSQKDGGSSENVLQEHPLQNANEARGMQWAVAATSPCVDVAPSQKERRAMFDEQMRLLRQSTNILQEAAWYFAESQEVVAQQARRTTKKPRERTSSFHAEIYRALLALGMTLDSNTEDITDHHDDLSAVFEDTLNLYEDLVDEQARQPGSDASHSRLRLLQMEYTEHQKEVRRPKPLGYLRYLFCPKPRTQHNLLSKIHCFQRKIDAILVEQTRFDILTGITRSTHEWLPPSSLRMHVPLISRELEHHWPCLCDQDHRTAHVSFTSSKDQDILGAYEFCLSTESGSHSAAALHLIRAELVEMSGKDHNASAKSVRFQKQESAQWQIWSPCNEICEAFAQGEGHYALRANLRCQVLRSPTCRLKSLRELIDTGTLKKLPALDRAILGALLTYTYLYTIQTPFWNVSEDEPEIWLKENVHTKELDIMQVFLRCPDRNYAPSGAQIWPKALNAELPSLPALGKLLFDIWRGVNSGWEAVINRHKDDDGADALGNRWLLAIDNCLDQCGILNKKGGDIRQDPDIRSAFVDRVAKVLQSIPEAQHMCIFEEALSKRRRSRALEKRVGEAAPQYRPTGHESSCSEFVARDDSCQLCLHDNDERESQSDPIKATAADDWQKKLTTDLSLLNLPHLNTARVKVAVLDTGVSFSKTRWALYQHRIRDHRSWVGKSDEVDGEECYEKNSDNDGHGTHTVSVLIDTNEACEVYVAKVFEGRNDKLGTTPIEATQRAVANAISYAVEKWEVDVISMSFGYAEEVDIITKAIAKAATKRNVVMFAAASNYGSSRKESWPARHGQVICIHATDGKGNKYWRNPTPEKGNDNFSVLGVEVEGWWKDDRKMRKSGTSVATPIAAGIAATFIGFMRNMKVAYLKNKGLTISEGEYDKCVQQLSSYSKMRCLFDKMAGPSRDEYRPIEPSTLLEESHSPDEIFVAQRILGIIRKA